MNRSIDVTILNKHIILTFTPHTTRGGGGASALPNVVFHFIKIIKYLCLSGDQIIKYNIYIHLTYTQPLNY